MHGPLSSQRSLTKLFACFQSRLEDVGPQSYCKLPALEYRESNRNSIAHMHAESLTFSIRGELCAANRLARRIRQDMMIGTRRYKETPPHDLSIGWLTRASRGHIENAVIECNPNMACTAEQHLISMYGHRAYKSPRHNGLTGIQRVA
jgi:hypothetical protein